MAYELSNGHVTDDVTKVLWSSTVGYPSDSLAFCLHSCCNFWAGNQRIATYMIVTSEAL